MTSHSWGDLASPQTPTLLSQMTSPPFTLPGKGSPGPDCGSSRPMHCNTCGNGFLGTNSCMLRTCPNCFRKWAAKESKKAGIRLWAGAQVKTGKKFGYRIVHAVISLPEIDDLPTLRKTARKIATDHGISGGALIWHPFRKPNETWIPDGTVHFHCLGLARGNILPGTSSDFVFKVIPDAIRKDYKGFQRAKEVKRCMLY